MPSEGDAKEAGDQGRRAVERALIASFLGSLLGILALTVERFALVSPVRAGAWAFYAVGAGVAAAVSRALAELWRPGYGGRAASLSVLAGFGGLHLGYFVNVKLLPSEPYWTARSLALALLVVFAVLCATGLLLRSARTQELRIRFGRIAAAGGFLSLAAGLTVLALEWPRSSLPVHRRGDGPSLLLLVLDSARRDHVGLYGHERPTTPRLDGWAPRARVFTQALSASSWTVPSAFVLVQSGNGAEPLARRLARRGYASACFTDNPHLHRGSRILEGFDHVERSVGRWRALVRGTVLGETLERFDPGDDARLVERAHRWFQAQTTPVFLYVHLMDSHTPYRHPPIDGRRRAGRRIEFPATGMGMSPDEAADVVARYDGGLLSTDRAAGRLLEELAGSGRPWLAVVTSDHGESLGEAGRWFHGQTLAPELLAVPLLVMGSGVEPGRFDGVVGHSAVPETLAAAAGLSEGGVDLRLGDGPGVAQGALPPDLLYRVEGDYKVLLDHEAGRTHLFNWRLDPGESQDLAKSAPALTAGLVAHLASGSAPATEPLAPEEIERLKSLGYAGLANEHAGSH